MAQVLGKGVESLDQQTAVAGFHVDAAEGPQRHAAAAVKRVHEPGTLRIQQQVLLDRPKDVRLGSLQLKVHLVHRMAAAVQVAMFASQAMTQQAAGLGQGVAGGGGNFGQRTIARPPRDHVAGAGDVDFRLVVAAVHAARSVDLK